MSIDKQRIWFLVDVYDTPNRICIVNARSQRCVVLWLNKQGKQYRIYPLKATQLLELLNATVLTFQVVDDVAPNNWCIFFKDNTVLVTILW